MKRRILPIMAIIVCFMVFALSFQNKAMAEEPTSLQHFIQNAEEHELKLANMQWFPFVASTRQSPALPWNWETFIFITNFMDAPVQVIAEASDFTLDRRNITLNMAPNSKRIISLQDFGIFNNIADVWVYSQPMGGGNRIGAAAIIFDPTTGDLLTSLPPISLFP